MKSEVFNKNISFTESSLTSENDTETVNVGELS